MNTGSACGCQPPRSQLQGGKIAKYGLPPETRNCEGFLFLTEQEVTFFLSFLYAPCFSLPSLNCNECAVNLFTNWGQRGYPEIYVITASTEAREQFLGLRRGRVLFNIVCGWTSPGDNDV